MSQPAKALIFNMVRGSFVDGFGIRTTIFLKGCPLRCRWCCNPEGQLFQPELKTDTEKCTGCGICLDKCPLGALTLSSGTICVDRKRCNGCGACTEVCAFGALEPFGRYWDSEEMFQTVARDKAFFDASGGGLTIGGGEATWHPDFVLELMEKCQSHGIHVAVDTCGYVNTEKGRLILMQADLLLFDIKGMNPVIHREGTGVDNGLIWENLRLRNKTGKPVIIRIPVIPGFSDDIEDLTSVAVALSKLSCIARVDLIPFHEFGKVKYQQLDKPYLMEGTPAISEERQEQLKSLFEFYGFEVQIGG